MERKRECGVRSVWALGATVAALAAYWVGVFLAPSIVGQANDLLDGALITAAVVVVWQYSSWALFNIRREIDNRFLIRFGIVLVWVGTILWRVERFWLQFSGGQIGAHDSARGFFILMCIIAGFYHVAGIAEPNRRSANVILTALFCLVGSAVVAMIENRF